MRGEASGNISSKETSSRQKLLPFQVYVVVGGVRGPEIIGWCDVRHSYGLVHPRLRLFLRVNFNARADAADLDSTLEGADLYEWFSERKEALRTNM